MTGYKVQDSGNRRDFETGAHRDMGEGKGRMDLLPYYALLELAKHFEAGAIKYDDNNWRKGIPLKVFFDSAMRHMAKMAMGYTDERHDLAALWNISCYIETKKRIEIGQLPDTLNDFPHVDLYTPQVAPTVVDRITATEIINGRINGAIPLGMGERSPDFLPLLLLGAEQFLTAEPLEDEWAPENCSIPLGFSDLCAEVPSIDPRVLTNHQLAERIAHEGFVDEIAAMLDAAEAKALAKHTTQARPALTGDDPDTRELSFFSKPWAHE